MTLLDDRIDSLREDMKTIWSREEGTYYTPLLTSIRRRDSLLDVGDRPSHTLDQFFFRLEYFLKQGATLAAGLQLTQLLSTDSVAHNIWGNLLRGPTHLPPLRNYDMCYCSQGVDSLADARLLIESAFTDLHPYLALPTFIGTQRSGSAVSAKQERRFVGKTPTGAVVDVEISLDNLNYYDGWGRLDSVSYDVPTVDGGHIPSAPMLEHVLGAKLGDVCTIVRISGADRYMSKKVCVVPLCAKAALELVEKTLRGIDKWV